MTLRMKRRWLKTLTAQDLADVPQEVLIDALCEKGAVFTTKEMARMAKCDEETIRRCIKAGHLKKTLGIRHNRVGAKRFFDWLFRRGD